MTMDDVSDTDDFPEFDGPDDPRFVDWLDEQTARKQEQAHRESIWREHCAEVVPGLWIGDCHIDPLWIRQQRIVTVVNCAIDCDHRPAQLGVDPAHYIRLDIVDDTDEDLSEVFVLARRRVQEALTRGPVLVHCMAGVSRSAAVVLAYLTADRTYEEALALLRTRWPRARPYRGFADTLRRLCEI